MVFEGDRVSDCVHYLEPERDMETLETGLDNESSL